MRTDATHDVELRLIRIPDALTSEQICWLRGELPEADFDERRVPPNLHPRVLTERLLGRYYQRNLLGELTKTEPSAWCFHANIHGKPCVTHPNIEAAPHINLSHTQGALLCGVSRGAPLGVDIESLHRRPDFKRLTERCFTKREVAFLEASPCYHHGFFRAWTLKEAYLKATGTGLRTPLQSVEILPDPENQLEIFRDGKRQNHWYVATEQHDDFVMSWAISDIKNTPPKTRLRQMTHSK